MIKNDKKDKETFSKSLWTTEGGHAERSTGQWELSRVKGVWICFSGVMLHLLALAALARKMASDTQTKHHRPMHFICTEWRTQQQMPRPSLKPALLPSFPQPSPWTSALALLQFTIQITCSLCQGFLLESSFMAYGYTSLLLWGCLGARHRLWPPSLRPISTLWHHLPGSLDPYSPKWLT